MRKGVLKRCQAPSLPRISDDDGTALFAGYSLIGTPRPPDVRPAVTFGFRPEGRICCRDVV
jgi:hypothetical protein